MKIEQIKTEKLIPYEFNNKVHWEDQIDRIANSITEFWFTQPIVVDKDNVVIIWHWRLLAAKKLWMEKVPCIKAEDLSKIQVKKLRILDNKLNESDWDLWNLKLELDEIDDDYLNDLFPEFDAPEYNPDDYEEWFNQHIENNSDLFNLHLLFPKEYRNMIEDYIKTEWKGILEEKIIDLILKETKWL